MVARRSNTGITNIVPEDGVLLSDATYDILYVSFSCIEKNGQNPTILLSLAEFGPGKDF